jgi:PAS domain S-box-containing protein
MRQDPQSQLKQQINYPLIVNQWVAQIASAIAILVGCLVLFGGWGLNLNWLKSTISGSSEMKANTALCFILAGISLGLHSLGLQTRRHSFGISRSISQGCALAVGLIGALTLSQYLFGWNLGIDELLFPDLPPDPGRMGDNTALNFVLVAIALWLLGQKTRKSDRTFQLAAILAVAIALLALIGYAYNVQIFYQFFFYSTSMALNTALTFLVLCVGILSIRADRGLMQTLTSNLTGGVVARKSLLIAIAFPSILGWLILQGLRAKLYDAAFGLALLVVLLIFILILVIWFNARWLNQTDYDRNRSEDRLRSSEEQLQLALLGSGQGTWDWDLRTETLTWDDCCKKIFGLLPDFSITYKWHLDALHPDDQQRVADSATIALQERTEFNEEYRTFYPDGTMHWILARGRGYYNALGEPYRMAGTVLNISDRKQTQLNEQFLNELDLRLRQLSDAKAMIWEAASSLGQYLNVDRCFWHKIDWENRVAIIERNWVRADVSDLAGIYPLENFFTSEQFDCLAAGETLVVSDVTTHPHTAPYAQSYQPLTVAAFVAVPCIQLGQWVANLSINVATARNWREDEVELLQEIVARLWPIIEQTRAVKALRKSEYQYRTLFESINQGFCVCQMLFDENGAPSDYRFLEINPAFEQMTGLQQAMGKTARELVPNLEDYWVQTYGQVALTGESIRFENQAKTMNRWFDVSAFSFGELEDRKFALLFTNITTRKQAEADLKERNDHIQILYETTRDLLSTYHPLALVDTLFAKLKPLIDLDVYFNYMIDQEEQKLHLLFYGGISDETARSIEWLEIGQAVCGTVAEQRCQIVQPNLQQSRDPKTELVRSLGLTVYSCQPLISQGKLFGTLGFGSRTKTDFKPLETQLFQAICDRIAIALDRAELLSSLQKQTEELKQLNRLKDEFLAALSHELRTPLNPILGWTKLLQTQKLTTVKTSEALSAIERNAKQQIVLVEDLLDISRIVQGKFKITVQPVDLAAILNAAIETVHFSAIAKSITLEVHFSSDGITPVQPFQNKEEKVAPSSFKVMGDPIRLQQIFWNLLANAIKFTPNNGRVDIWLEKVQETESEERGRGLQACRVSRQDSPSTRNEEDFQLPAINHQQQATNNQQPTTSNEPLATHNQQPTAHYVQIRFTDTGIGIAPEFLPHVFDRFRQADGSSTRSYSGLGLGLSLVKHLVELHGGTVKAESPGEGQGATFKVKLPLLQEQTSSHFSATSNLKHSPTDGLSLSTSTSTSSKFSSNCLSGIRVLVVDDEPDNLDLLDIILTQEGAIATTVTTGKEALEIASIHPFDLLISDIGMPEMNGYQLLQQLRTSSSEPNNSIPAIALTAFAQREDEEKTISAGFQAYFAKPFDIIELVDAIAILLDRTRT